MTVTTSKLEEVHADLWGPHNPPSRSRDTYSAILMCEHTRKTWTLNLRGKDEFVDAFQVWLPKVEAESGCSMKHYVQTVEESSSPSNFAVFARRLIGKLMYLACGTRPNVAFEVGQLSKHNSDPQRGHLRAAKRVVRYLKGTINLGLVYGRSTRHPPPYGLIGYADNFARDPEDRKSVIGYCFFLNGAVVSWRSKKQQTVSTSTTEAEYIAFRTWGKRGRIEQEIRQ